MPIARKSQLILLILLTFALAPHSGARAADSGPRFEVPVDCQIGTVCTVQNYFDMDPGPEARDHTCGPLTYEGHKGIDIRVPTYVEMRQGVAVVAAAPGVVKGVRDSMPDISLRDRSDPNEVKGREAGNGVVVDHGNGWVTQYSHLKRSSIVVVKGQRVMTGDKLGLIGLSGRTEFPHVHFSIRHNGKAVDPYTGLEQGAGCGKSKRSLWSEAARQRLTYRAGGLLAAGFADTPPKLPELIKGGHRHSSLAVNSPALLFWAVAWGLRGGDREQMQIVAPDGRVMAKSEKRVPKNKARWYRFIGRKLKARGWPPGIYNGTYRVVREENGVSETIIDVTRVIEVR